jgi:hypothetical protein
LLHLSARKKFIQSPGSRHRRAVAPPRARIAEVSVRTRENDCLEYATSTNPPILHRKETFLTADHPLHARFARLSQQEEKHGLLDDAATIGTREGWEARLSGAGFALRGHRLVRR